MDGPKSLKTWECKEPKHRKASHKVCIWDPILMWLIVTTQRRWSRLLSYQTPRHLLSKEQWMEEVNASLQLRGLRSQEKLPFKPASSALLAS